MDANNIRVVLIPSNSMDHLQLLGSSVNKATEEFLRNSSQKWYASIVSSQLNGEKKEKAVDLHLLVIKPHGAKWLIELHEYLRGKLYYSHQWI